MTAIAFPIVLEDSPGEPEGRLLIYLRSGEMLASLPLSDVRGALQALRLDGGSRGGQAILEALQEAVRTRRDTSSLFVESDPWAGPSQEEVDAVVQRIAAGAEGGAA